MINGIRVSDPRGINKGLGLKFYVSSGVQQESFEGLRIYRPKCEYSNKEEGNCLKTLIDKNYQASLEKFRQLMHGCYDQVTSFKT